VKTGDYRMARFVILQHTGTSSYKPGVHWDLMLECEGKLRTWEIDSVPSANRPSWARALSDHRIHYLNYEGPLTGERGEVRRFDAGTYETVRDEPDELIVDLRGGQLVGHLALKRTNESVGGWHVTLDTTVCSGLRPG
jgi:hypothetical protein